MHIVEQLKEHHQRPFQKKDYSRYECFIRQEKTLLQPLPADKYFIRHSVKAKVQRNYHITLGEDWHHYSVPFSFIGKTVNAIYAEKPLYKIQEICALFKVTKPTIYDWIKHGKLKRVKIRSRVYFPDSDIKLLMQA